MLRGSAILAIPVAPVCSHARTRLSIHAQGFCPGLMLRMCACATCWVLLHNGLGSEVLLGVACDAWEPVWTGPRGPLPVAVVDSVCTRSAPRCVRVQSACVASAAGACGCLRHRSMKGAAA
jgi:hypothetical protein